MKKFNYLIRCLLLSVLMYNFTNAAMPYITYRWGENTGDNFTGVTHDCIITNGANENSEYLGIRSDDNKCTLIYFDLSAIQKNTFISAAKLRIYFEVAYGTVDSGVSGYMMNLYRIEDPENLGMWDESQATVTQRKDGVPWISGGDIFSSLSSVPVDAVFSHPTSYGMGAENFWVEWNVITTVKGWVKGDYPNNGLLLDGRVTLGADAIARSSSNPNIKTRPYLEIKYEGIGTYPQQATNVQAQYKDGQTFVTWKEIEGDSAEIKYRIYRHSDRITVENFGYAALLAEVSQGSANFPQLAENNGRLSTPFSSGPLPDSSGLYVYTDESSGNFYYAVTSVSRGNENLTFDSTNMAGPIIETASQISPVLQYREFQNDTASGNRNIYIVWLGKFDPTGKYSDYGYNNQSSVPYIFRVTTPEVWDILQSYPLITLFHYYGDSYFGSGHSVPEPGRFVFAPDDYDPKVKSNEFGHTMWYGYNCYYGTRYSPIQGAVVNYTERRIEFMLDWILHRSNFKIDTNRIYMKGGSMGGVAQWAFGMRHPEIFTAGETQVPGVNLNYDPNQRHFPLWGYEKIIPSVENIPVSERIDAGKYAFSHVREDLPIMLAFVRKNDEHILWGQMPPFFEDMNISRHLGGMIYWVQGDHINGEFPWTVFPEWQSEDEYLDWIYRFSSNQSYPAFSNCMLNDEPGNGTTSDGDLRGGINRFLRWDNNSIVDRWNRWEINISLHSAAPVSTTFVDITPRRLQNLVHSEGKVFKWANKELSTGNTLQSGTVTASQYELFYLSGIQISKEGNKIIIADDPDDVADNNDEFLLEQNFPNPFSEMTSIGFSLASDSHITMKIYDVLGNEMQTITDGIYTQGYHRVTLDATNMRSGKYFCRLNYGNTYRIISMDVIK
ncbi:MAG: DNRLRE domain-containing protein [Bacteroidetes bacterium]|nr:MAG: DNRLRE domain-containing protein [Bacteroidota bacterium]